MALGVARRQGDRDRRKKKGPGLCNSNIKDEGILRWSQICFRKLEEYQKKTP